MTWALAAAAVILGLLNGSFTAVVVTRLRISGAFSWKQTLGLDNKRSICDSCKRQLCWWENIPVASFVFLKGRCRTCHSPIPFWFLLAELFSGLTFLLTYLYWQKNFINLENHWLILAILFLIASLLVITFWVDLFYKFIFDELVIILTLLALGYHLLLNNDLLSFFLSGLSSAGFFLFLYLITKGRGMGLGDVKLSFFLGFFLGLLPSIIGYYFAFFTGAIYGLGIMVLKGKSIKTAVPFGPFLILGFWFSLLFFPRLYIFIKDYLPMY